MIYLEAIVEIQCNLFIIITFFHYTMNQKTIFKTFLEYLVNYNSLVNDVYIEFMADIKYQLHLLHLEKYVLLEIFENIAKNYIGIYFLVLVLSYLCWERKKRQRPMLDNT